MFESHQPADDHAEQPQEAARHQKEVHHCQTRTCKQPSSSTQVKLKNSFFQIFTTRSSCFITYCILSIVLWAFSVEFRLYWLHNVKVKRILFAANDANGFALDGAAT